jgi:hypothetical protein
MFRILIVRAQIGRTLNLMIRTIVDFLPHLVITSIIILNILFGFLKSRTVLTKRKKVFFFQIVPLFFFPILILCMGYLLDGLPFDANRSDFMPRTWPIYSTYIGNIAYAFWVSYRSKGFRWLMVSVSVLFLWLSLFLVGFSIGTVANNIFI